MSDTRTPREIAVPVRTVMNAAVVRGLDAEGRECLYGVMAQHDSEIGMFLLQIDLDTGESVRFDMPAGIGCGPLLWSERWRRFFTYVSRGMHGNGHLCEFDPATGAPRDLGRVDPDRESLAVSLAEAPDGTLYLGSYSQGCSLSSYRPDTGASTHYGVIDASEFYFYVNCGADGTVAGLVKMARPRVVALDVSTGAYHAIGPVADTDAQQGRVELVKGADGLLYIDSHDGAFRVDGIAAVPVASIPRAVGVPTLADGSTYRFLDGRADNVWLCRYRTVEIAAPDGARKVLHLDYQAEGSSIYLLHGATNGRIYGSSILPLHFFEYDPVTDETTHHGACSTASGEVYSMDCMNDMLYLCCYTHAILCEYDLARPFSWGGPAPAADGQGLDFPKGRRGDNLSHTYDENDNPKQLGRMDEVSYRARDMVAGPAGKVWTVSIPDYGMWGGVLSWYDPATGTFGGGHRHIIENCSPISITHLADQDLLAIGFSKYGGSGTIPKVEKAGLALWEPNADEFVWAGDLGLDIVGVMDLEDAGDGLAYAIVHCLPEDVLAAHLMLLDLPRQRIVARLDLTERLGWPLEVSLQRDDKYLYGLTCEGLYRVPLGTLDLEILWQDKDDGPGPMIGAGALVDGVYYFGSGARLRSIPVA